MGKPTVVTAWRIVLVSKTIYLLSFSFIISHIEQNCNKNIFTLNKKYAIIERKRNNYGK